MQCFSLLQNVHHPTNSQEVQHRPRNARGKPWAQEIYLHILWRTATTNLLRFLQISTIHPSGNAEFFSASKCPPLYQFPTHSDLWHRPSRGTDLSRHVSVWALSAQVPEYCHRRNSGLAPVCIPERQSSRQCHHVRPSPHLEHLGRPEAYARILLINFSSAFNTAIPF